MSEYWLLLIFAVIAVGGMIFCRKKGPIIDSSDSPHRRWVGGWQPFEGKGDDE